jgi:hypothetical protein
MTKRFKTRMIASALSLVAVASVVLVCRTLWNSLILQVNNSILLDRYCFDLEKYRRQAGRYPASFNAVDIWNRPLFYQSTPERFILVSFGRDGRADASYDVTGPPGNTAQNCFWPDADTVFLESGPVRYCLK